MVVIQKLSDLSLLIRVVTLQIYYSKANSIVLVFYNSLVEKSNCQNTTFFDSCFSFSLLPPYFDKVNFIMTKMQRFETMKRLFVEIEVKFIDFNANNTSCTFDNN